MVGQALPFLRRTSLFSSTLALQVAAERGTGRFDQAGRSDRFRCADVRAAFQAGCVSSVMWRSMCYVMPELHRRKTELRILHALTFYRDTCRVVKRSSTLGMRGG